MKTTKIRKRRPASNVVSNKPRQAPMPQRIASNKATAPSRNAKASGQAATKPPHAPKDAPTIEPAPIANVTDHSRAPMPKATQAPMVPSFLRSNNIKIRHVPQPKPASKKSAPTKDVNTKTTKNTISDRELDDLFDDGADDATLDTSRTKLKSVDAAHIEESQTDRSELSNCSTNSDSRRQSQDSKVSDITQSSSAGGDKSLSLDAVSATATAQTSSKESGEAIALENDLDIDLTEQIKDSHKPAAVSKTTGGGSTPRDHTRQVASEGSTKRKRFISDDDPDPSKRPALENRNMARLRVSTHVVISHSQLLILTGSPPCTDA